MFSVVFVDYGIWGQKDRKKSKEMREGNAPGGSGLPVLVGFHCPPGGAPALSCGCSPLATGPGLLCFTLAKR